MLAQELARYGLAAVFSDPPFEWSGRNSHVARQHASTALHAHLAATPLQRCRCPQFIIGHSHGGNVALQCLKRDTDLAAKVSGVVTLATPFLVFNRREAFFGYFADGMLIAASALWGSLGKLLPYAIVGIVFLPFAVVAGFEERAAWGYLFEECDRAIGIDCARVSSLAVMALVGLLAAVCIAWLLRQAYRVARAEHAARCDERFTAVLDQFSYFQPTEQLGRTPILLCSSSFDEALGVLQGSWWLHRLWSWNSSLAAIGTLLTSFLGTLALAVGALYLMMPYIFSIDGAEWIFFLLGVLLFAATMLAGAQISRFVLRLGSVSPGLGFGSSDVNRFVKVRAVRAVHISDLQQNHRFSAWSLFSASNWSLFHSRLYGSPAAIALIAAWMAGIVAQDPTPKQT